MKTKLLAIVILTSILTACGHSIIMPGSMRQRPEVSGKLWGGEVSAGVQKTIEVRIFDDISTNPPRRLTAGTDGFLIEAGLPILPYLDVGLGIHERVDLYYTTGIGARVLVYGDMKEEGWKATVFAGSVINDSSTKYDEGTTSAKTKLDGIEFGVSVGKNLNKSSIAYFTVGQQQGNAKTNITQPTRYFSYKDKFAHTIMMLGISMGEKFFFDAELGSAFINWKTTDSGEDERTTFTFSVGGGLKW